MSKVVQSAIRSSHYGNCKYCRNKSTSYCEECEHYDHEYYDYWESIAPEEMAQMEKEEELKSAVKNAVTKYILVHIPDDFNFPAGKSPPVKVGMTVPKELSERVHCCPYCGLTLDRDVNAARNILKRVLALEAA